MADIVTISIVAAVLKFLLKKKVTDEFADTLGEVFIDFAGDKFDNKFKEWMGIKTNQQALEGATLIAKYTFIEKVGDRDLSLFMQDLPIDTLPKVAEAIEALPKAADESQLENAVREAFAIDRLKFTPQQIDKAVKIYLSCMEDAVMPLEEEGFGVMRLAIMELKKRMEKVEGKLEKVEGQVGEIDGKLEKHLNDSHKKGKKAVNILPAAKRDFTGRINEIETLKADFADGVGTAISGLTGMGGIGKTELGLVVGHAIEDKFPDGQVYLDLKGTTQPLAAEEAARALILLIDPDQNLRELDKAGLLANYQALLNAKKVLLFLDNARSADQVRPLLPPAGCGVLVTSRWKFPLPGIKMHRLGVFTEQEAQDFLKELYPQIGAQAVELARLCGYLPLALRLAGGYLAVNDGIHVDKYLEQLTQQRLETIHEAQAGSDTDEQDLKAAFELSYQCLSREQAAAWRMMGVFTADFAPEAASAVWNLELKEGEKLLRLFGRYNLLDYLEEKERYKLHDLLGEFARMKLGAEEDFAAHWNHGVFFYQVASNANELYLQGGEHVLEGLRLFDREWAHLQAAQSWAAEHIQSGAAELALRLPNAGINCLGLRLNAREQIGWLESGLQAARFLKNKEYEGYHLGNLGIAYAALGETRKAIEYYEQHIAITQETGDRRGQGADLRNLGNAYANLGETRRAIEFYEQALEIDRWTGDRRGQGATLGNLGIAYADLGETRQAIEYYEQVLEIEREIGDRLGEGYVLGNLGNAYDSLGETRRAIEYHEQALEIDRETGDRRGQGADLGNLGIAYYRLGETRKAIEHFEQQLAITRETGDRRGEGNALGNLGNAYYSLGETRRAIEYYEQHLAITHQTGDQRGQGNTLGNLGNAYAELGETRRAIEFYEQQLAIMQETGDRRGEGIAYFNMGLAYQKLGEIEKARELGQKALELYTAVENPYAEKVRKWLEGLELPGNLASSAG